MARRSTLDVFGLSFLDMISCGLGGVLVLMLIFSARVESLAAPPAPRPSDEEVPPERAYFHLGVRCVGIADESFDVVVDMPPELRASASRLEERRSPLSAKGDGDLQWSLLQRGLQGQGRIEVTLGASGGTLAAVETLRQSACEYGFRDPDLDYDRGVAKDLLALTESLEASRSPEAWQAAMAALRQKLEDCGHDDAKTIVVAALEDLDDAWESHRAVLAPASSCHVELVTSLDVQTLDLEVVGAKRVSVEVMGSSYALSSGIDRCPQEGP